MESYQNYSKPAYTKHQRSGAAARGYARSRRAITGSSSAVWRKSGMGRLNARINSNRNVGQPDAPPQRPRKNHPQHRHHRATQRNHCAATDEANQAGSQHYAKRLAEK